MSWVYCIGLVAIILLLNNIDTNITGIRRNTRR